MIEETLNALRAAIETNTAVLREVLAAGGAPAPSSVITMPESPKPAKKKAEKVEPVTAVEEPVTVVEEAPDIELPESPEEPATETTLDPEALITQITDMWKTKLTNADPVSKMNLKDKFPELRAKWGLAADAKLITLAPTPEKLAGLLADIKDL